ncbi:hypothetical protein [Paenibacillus sp. USHLN196]|uniref:hypothetical protein n=1 Tax=Paenibacillus sp. USHLN196 TaxID=3081291 RepID=UPI00301B4022
MKLMQGLIRSSSELIVTEALALGADLVGGVDPAGLDGDMERSLQMMFDIATAADKGIDLHLHDGGEPGLATLRRFAELTMSPDFNIEQQLVMPIAWGSKLNLTYSQPLIC